MLCLYVSVQPEKKLYIFFGYNRLCRFAVKNGILFKVFQLLHLEIIALVKNV